jgi:hypothetical protein
MCAVIAVEVSEFFLEFLIIPLVAKLFAEVFAHCLGDIFMMKRK